MTRAAIAIPEKLFFKIGEVCEITGVQAHVLRYWESEFPMLAPQKNRAGQRTYRKRDVEMALRIKELLYDDQYTIAGAKKKLVSELRGASKLKVVTPEMSAAAATTAPAPPPQPPSVAPQVIQPEPAPAPPALEARSSYAPPASAAPPAAGSSATATDGALTEDQRLTLRRLAGQMRELLAILDGGEAELPQHKK